MPSDLAASIWPLSIESIPARMISRMYAPSLMLSATMPAMASAEIVQRLPRWSVGELNVEVDEEDLDEQRRAAEDPDVDSREPAQRSEARHARMSAATRPSSHAEDLGDDRDVDRRPEGVPEDVARMEDPLPDDVPVDCDDEHVHLAAVSLLVLQRELARLPLREDRLHLPVQVERLDGVVDLQPERVAQPRARFPRAPSRAACRPSRTCRRSCGCSRGPAGRRRSRRRRGRTWIAWAALVSAG